MHHSIALLLFAQDAKKDALSKKKGWSSTLRQTTTVFESLTKRTLQTVRKSRLPFFLSSDVCTGVDSFGGQLTSAVRAVFGKGFQAVICIGNDCPELTVEILQKTTTQLQNGQSVIGPDTHGGVYLIGIQKEDFQATVFKNLPWQTPQLREDLGQLLGNRTVFLPAFVDINAETDLHHWAEKANSFGKLLLSLLVQLPFSVVFLPIYAFSFYPTSYRLRPPPGLVP